jgi:sulfur carrier protein ThiS
MSIKIQYEQQHLQLNHIELPLSDILTRLDICAESHLIMRDGELLLEEDLVFDGDLIKIISVVSKG